MKLISDIWREKNRKYGMYECPDCKDVFKRRTDTVGGRCSVCNNRKIAKQNKFVKNKRIHNIWTGMKARTTNPNHRDWKKYGAKGISLCNEWKDYKNFEAWALGSGYEDNLSIDRIDTYKEYSPLNCRWANATTQSRNTRVIHKTNKTGYRGVSKLKQKFRAAIQVDKKSIHLGIFDTAIDAALSYDNYVLSNNLEHSINNIEEV